MGTMRAMSGNVVVTTVAPDCARCRYIRSTIRQCAIEEQSGTGDVVHAHADADQIGSHRQGLGQLVVEHIADAAAADRQIGVPQAGMQFVEHRGQPVGESHDSVGIVAVPESLGLAVAQGDIAGVHAVRHARDSSGRTGSG